ncbi:hypothetical protein QX201_011601 [Fusarium graminearum]
MRLCFLVAQVSLYIAQDSTQTTAITSVNRTGSKCQSYPVILTTHTALLQIKLPVFINLHLCVTAGQPVACAVRTRCGRVTDPRLRQPHSVNLENPTRMR